MIRRLLLLTLFVVSVVLPSASRAEQARPVPQPTSEPLAITPAPLGTGASDLDQPITITQTFSTPVDNVFTQVQTMSVPRAYHTATLLSTGHIIVAGGINGRTDFASADRFDPITHQITSAGNMTYGRSNAAAALLPSGEVLMTGGSTSLMAEIYNPTTNQWRLAAAMHSVRSQHTATTLLNGTVLIVGGATNGFDTTSVEMYNPATNQFTVIESLTFARRKHHAVLLADGDVLVVGGESLEAMGTAERYSPSTGHWRSIPLPHLSSAAMLQLDGQVLIGGEVALRYDPLSDAITDLVTPLHLDIWQMVPLGSDKVLMFVPREVGAGGLVYNYTVTYSLLDNSAFWTYEPPTPPMPRVVVLPDGRLVATGGVWPGRSSWVSNGIMMTQVNTPTHYTATVTFPGVRQGDDIWLTRYEVPVRLQVWAEPARLDHVSIQIGENLHPPEFDVASGQVISTTVQHTSNEQTWLAIAVREQPNDVNIYFQMIPLRYDPNPPSAAMSYLPSTTSSPFQARWGSDGLWQYSSTYDLAIRAADAITWTQVLTNTLIKETHLHTPSLGSYDVRVRSHDHLGRISPWSEPQRTQVTAISLLPAPIWLNQGAKATTTPVIKVYLAGQLVQPDVAEVRLSDDGLTWQPWQPYGAVLDHTLSAPDGLKGVSVQFRSTSGSVSAPIFATIRLDTHLGDQPAVSINDGATFTNDPWVRVMTAGSAQTYAMQISNDGGFGGAVWQPFDTQPLWRISPYGNYTIPRTVYVRVRTPWNESTIVSDDIIYDPFAPTGSLTVTTQTSTTLSIALSASDPDGISGLGGMRVGTPQQFAVAGWERFAPNKTLAVTDTTTLQPIYAQFRDNANNMTPILCVTPAGAPCGLTPRTYLSFIKQ